VEHATPEAGSKQSKFKLTHYPFSIVGRPSAADDAPSKWKSDRDVQRPARVFAARVEIVAVLELGGANDRLPANTPAGRVQSPARRIVADIGRDPQGVHETHHRPRTGQRRSARERERPQFILRVCCCVPPSVPRQTERLRMAIPSPFPMAFIVFAPIRHLHRRAIRFARGQRNEAAKFALCYGPQVCLPCTDQDFYG
jgi:hypothetical protein